jgi:hypothetical protein
MLSVPPQRGGTFVFDSAASRRALNSINPASEQSP